MDVETPIWQQLYFIRIILFFKELILKSKLETEKLEVIAMLTNLKLVNVRLAKENMELKEKINNNKNTASVEDSPGTPDMIVSKNSLLKDRRDKS